MRRGHEQPKIDFELNPDLVAYAGHATIPEMIVHLPGQPGDQRRPHRIRKAHELRFVRMWYQHGHSGLLLQANAVELISEFGIAPDEQAAEMLLLNTVIQPGGSIAEDSRREFTGGRARWTRPLDLLDPPTGYHLESQGYQTTEAYMIRPHYSAA